MFTSYFFMKVGFGNCLLQHAVRSAEARTSCVLWVGYTNEAVPSFESGATTAGVSADLLRMTRAAWDEESRRSTRVLTFRNESLHVWRITDRVRPISDAELDSLMQTYAGDPVVFQKFGFALEDLESLRSALRSKVLPVRLENVIKRALLPACVDSLSVYQALNRGTFRFLGPTNGPVQKGARLGVLEPEVVPVLLPNEKAWRETPFACFVRKYLDWCLDQSAEGSFAERHGLSGEEVVTLATTVMSPSQLEVAAAVLVQSLGMTLDAGVGKGLDVVDVRASIRHRRGLPEYRSLLEHVAKSLERLMGGPVAPSVLDVLNATGSLELQCKNYDVGAEKFDHPGLVLFTPTGRPNGRCITLAAVRSFIRSHPGSLPTFEDWLALLGFAYTEPRATLGFASAEDLRGTRGSSAA